MWENILKLIFTENYIIYSTSKQAGRSPKGILPSCT
jgi:hypothetical protein